MNRTAIFSKTGKGLLEIKNRANRLSKDQYRLLNLVDGKSTLLDLADRARMSEADVRRVLNALAESGYVKEFTNATSEVGVMERPPVASYADDLDFSTALPAPIKPSIYQSALTEQRQREEAERKASEAAATKARAESERRAKEEARRAAEAEQAARKIREEAERKAKQESEREQRFADEMRRKMAADAQARADEERRAQEAAEEVRRREREEKLLAEQRAKEEAERRARIQSEARARLEAERRAKEEEERRRKEEEERKRREEEERRRKEEEERKRRAEEERRRKEEEERKRREEEERRRKEEEERNRREEEERRRKEEAARKQREEEERLRKEEEERKRREEEERRRKEEVARKQREEEERLRKEEEERKRREDEKRRRKEEAQRKQREDEERLRKEEEERRLREEEQARARSAQRAEVPTHAAPSAQFEGSVDEADDAQDDEIVMDLSDLPSVEIGESDVQALLRVEAEVEKEFLAKEEAIRVALAEQERRFRMEEEARAAMDRAEREARERADQEARELALAAEQARKEAEQKAREDAARRAEEEKERRAREKAERKKQEAETRKKRERERREAEQRAREDDLVRRRKEQDETDRRKSELDRLHHEVRRRAWGPGKISAAAVALVVVLAMAIIQFVPFSVYAPDVGRSATQAIGEPVRVESMRASLFPSFHLELEKVTIGDLQDVHAANVSVYLGIGSLFGEEKDVERLVIDGLEVPQESLARVASWLMRQAESKVHVARLQLQSAKLDLRMMDLPPINADLSLDAAGAIRSAGIESTDGHFTARFDRGENGMALQSSGRNLRLPFGPPLEFTDYAAKGVLQAGELRIDEIEYSLYGGHGMGSARAAWGNNWMLEGNFSFARMDLQAAMQALQAHIPSQGVVDAKGTFSMQSPTLDGLFNAARVEASFTGSKGVLSGIDLVRALQSPSREGTAGGQTKFEELSGNFLLNNGRYQLTGLRASAGALTASGQAEVTRDEDISGRVSVELRSSSRPIRSTFRLGGTTKGMLLRQ